MPGAWSGEVGAGCALPVDCRGGLLCLGGTCQPPRNVEAFTAVSCAPEPPENPPRAYFSLSQPGDTGEFFRLPFPNDLYDGRVPGLGARGYAAHPRPGAGFLPLDPLGVYLDALAEENTPYGTNPAVFLRFSHEPDFESFRRPGAVRLYDLTPSNESADGTQGPKEIRRRWWATGWGNRFLCWNNLVVRPNNWAEPLKPNHTYAMVVTDAITTSGDAETGVLPEPMGRDTDFAAIVGPIRPVDPVLGAAWDVYAPLRLLISDIQEGRLSTEPERVGQTVIGGTLFTVGDPQTRARGFTGQCPARWCLF